MNKTRSAVLFSGAKLKIICVLKRADMKNKKSGYIRRELIIFFHALTFLTRVPGPAWMDFSREYLNRSSRYFSLTGLLVGLFSAAIFIVCIKFFPLPLSVMLSMISSVFITGAFHEDGFADVCDGFGGGYSKEQILQIMKDSRTGTYGAIGLILTLMLKYFSLLSMEQKMIPLALIAGHTISRLASTGIIFFYKYVRDDDTSRSKPLADKTGIIDLLINAIVSVIPFLFFSSLRYLLLFIPVILSAYGLAYYFKRKIGGYTGDCLGAVQQVSEVVFYLFLAVR